VNIRENLFLTGPKHIGKSTALFSALPELPVTLGGFRVDRVFEGRRLRAFRIVDLATSSAADISTARKGGWDVHLEAFETVGVEAIRRGIRSADLVVMDELGRFELRAYGFRQAVTDALDSPVPVIGVLKEDDNPFLNEIRSREDTEVLEVTEENRDGVKGYVEDWLSRVLAEK
jgi:nucleoside-triphosphatase